MVRPQLEELLGLWRLRLELLQCEILIDSVAELLALGRVRSTLDSALLALGRFRLELLDSALLELLALGLL